METKRIQNAKKRNKKTCTIFLTATCLLLSTTAFEAQALEIRGSRSCGKWVNERALKGLESVITETWFVGYLSGLAAANDKDFLKGTDKVIPPIDQRPQK